MKKKLSILIFAITAVVVSIAIYELSLNTTAKAELIKDNIEALAEDENSTPVYDCPGGRKDCVTIDTGGGFYVKYYKQ
ncbi:MAG: NVEALA domain-containing protein [Rikenellaceae bacterium]|nr:NVEALA domain-containing protein [Rikenellaceae bacterium]